MKLKILAVCPAAYYYSARIPQNFNIGVNRMRKLCLFTLVLFLVCSGFSAAKNDQVATIPDKVLDAKSVIIGTYWPEGDIRDRLEIQNEGEQFVSKWGRYKVTEDINQADLFILVVVRPTEVMPGFWQRLAAAYAAQGQTYCHTDAQDYGGGTVQAQTHCTTYAGNQQLAKQAMLPSTVLGGSILFFDAADIRADIAAGKHVFEGQSKPLIASFAEAKGSAPLRGTAKHLRKLIDNATKQRNQERAQKPPAQ